MEILHGLFLLVVLRFSSSTVVHGISGSSATLDCVYTTTASYQWQRHLGAYWGSAITNGMKYEGADTRYLTINDLVSSDAGRYRCTVLGGEHTIIDLVVSGEGVWSDWTEWNQCTKTCGGGVQARTRTCTGGTCIGSSVESRDCNTHPCPVDGNWGLWTVWAACSLSCGGGTRRRYRYCTNPPPSNGGSVCPGSSQASELCSLGPCPVDGNWGLWNSWTACSLTCGGGTRTRYRNCTDPPPSNGGSVCPGSSQASEACSSESCSVNGQWGSWTYWSPCSVTCNSGTTSRQRSCDNPVLVNNGSDCEGNNNETDTCSIKCTDIETSSIPVGGVVAGSISACVVVLTVAVLAFLLIRRRRQKGSANNNEYEVSEMKRGDEHFYIQTRPKNEYYNTDLHSPRQVENIKDLLTEYDSSQFSKFLVDEHSYVKTLKEEFKKLTETRPRDHGTDYEVVNVESESGMSYDTYVNKAVVKKHTTDKISVITETPTKHNMEMFWTLAHELKIHDIILLVQRKEKISDFFPTTDEPMETHNLEVRMISSGRQHDGIFLYSLELFDESSRNVSETSLFKTTNWKIGETFPDISTLCKLITTQNEPSKGVLMVGSKGSGYRICGVLSVCLGVVYAIRDDKKFSILQIALDLVKTRPDLFQTFEEYELCYNILRRYLENEHCYAVIN